MELHYNDRELNVEEIIKDAWLIYKEYFPVLLPAIIICIALNISQTTLHHILFRPYNKGQFLSDLSFTAIYGILENFITISVALIVDNAIKGEAVKFKETLKKAFGFWPSSIWAHFLVWLIIGLLLLMVVITITIILIAGYALKAFGSSSIWVFPLSWLIMGCTLSIVIVCVVYYYFVTFAVVLRGKKGKEVLKYSKSLVKNRWWKVFHIVVAFVVLQIAPVTYMNISYELFQKKLTYSSLVTSVPLELNLISSLFTSILFTFFITATVVLFRNLESLNNVPEPVDKPVNPLDLVPTFGKDKKAIEQIGEIWDA